MESIAYNKNLGFEMRFRYGQKACSKLVESLGYAREISEAIDIVKSLYKKGAVYRYFDLGDMQEQSKAKLYNALKSVNKQYLGA